MPDLLGGLYVLYVLLLGPGWAGELTGLWFISHIVAAGQLAVIVLSALRPVWWASRAGRVAQRVWRVALTLVAIAALNFVLNLIWPFRF
jgi:hypothetical protein